MITINDYPRKWGINFQDEATPIMIGVRDLHDSILYYLIIIIILVGYLLIINMNQIIIPLYNVNKDLSKSSILEFIWTIFPGMILILIAIPSFKLLYYTEEILTPLITIKIIGNQWYWTYEIEDNIKIRFDSYIKESLLYNLDVDNKLILPILTPIRLLITASDVIHSWAVPSLGIKLDAIPGRINYNNLYILREGEYYGQCSELCGIGHSYMPIGVKGVNMFEYKKWLISNIEENILKLIKIINK